MINSIEMLITPEMATEWLENKANPNNRSIRANVAALANDMKNGIWRLNGESIVFNDDGMLVDGHHRLTACKLAGVPFRSLVVFGVKEYDVYDIGNARTVTDISKFKNVSMKDVSSKSSIHKALLILAGWSEWDVRSVSKSDDLEFIQKNDSLLSAAVSLSRRGCHSRALMKRAPLMTAVTGALANGYEETEIFEFVKVVNTGFPSETRDSTSAIALRNTLIDNDSYTFTTRIRYQKIGFTTAHAMKDFHKGVKRTKKYAFNEGNRYTSDFYDRVLEQVGIEKKVGAENG